MATHENSHDKLFKQSLADPADAVRELRGILPSGLVARIDWETLTPLPGTFHDEVLHGSHADQLYSVRCADHETLLYVLMEHKSESDRWTLLQLLRYMLRIWEQCIAQKPPPATLPPIIPVIIHHSEAGWTAPTHFHGLFEPVQMNCPELQRLTPEFEVQLDDISHLSNDELRARAMGPAATLGFVFLRDGRRDVRILDAFVAWADLFHALHASPNGERAMLQLFSYLWRVTPNLSLDELTRRIRETIPETENVIMTIADQLLEKGMQRGRQEGYRTLVRRQIALKFGPLDASAVARLDSADEAALERYSERVLTATSIDDVLGE
jgi:predicted transposase YdaD